MWWVSGGVILIVTVATLAWTYGARIDRLHRRIASARLRLDRHLVKRSAEAVRLADSGALTKEWVEAAERIRDCDATLNLLCRKYFGRG